MRILHLESIFVADVAFSTWLCLFFFVFGFLIGVNGRIGTDRRITIIDVKTLQVSNEALLYLFRHLQIVAMDGMTIPLNSFSICPDLF